MLNQLPWKKKPKKIHEMMISFAYYFVHFGSLGFKIMIKTVHEDILTFKKTKNVIYYILLQY